MNWMRRATGCWMKTVITFSTQFLPQTGDLLKRWNTGGSNVLAFRRIAKDGSQLLFVFNFCPNEYRDFRVEVPMETYWKEILSTDEKCYGGSGNYENGIREAYFDCGRAVISTDMAPLSAAIFELV